METIFLIMVFVAPGMICKELNSYIKKERKIQENLYAFLFDVVTDSVIIGGITISLLLLFGKKLHSFSDLITHLNSFRNLLIYITIMVCASILWFTVKNKLLGLILALKNKLLKKTEGIQHSAHYTDWDELMHLPDLKDSLHAVSVYKDDVHLDDGLICNHSSTNAEEFEIRLQYTEEMKKLMKERPEIFKVRYDYYNVSTGLRVLVYRQSIIAEHWPYNLTFWADQESSAE